MTLASGLYAGPVSHTRLRPRRHALRYRVFMLLLDLDELDQIDGALRLLKINRAGLLSFHERDHADGKPGRLKTKIEAVLSDAGLPFGGPIRLLTMPRLWGFGFNPISVYFCHGVNGRLSALLYEVNNTFGDRHSYLIPVTGQGAIDQSCAKRLFVSPFMQMDMNYRFRVRPPQDEIALLIDGSEAEGVMITTSFIGQRTALSDKALLQAVLAHPLLTLKVVAGIHWEALKLLLKGVRLVRRAPAPVNRVSLTR